MALCPSSLSMEDKLKESHQDTVMILERDLALSTALENRLLQRGVETQDCPLEGPLERCDWPLTRRRMEEADRCSSSCALCTG